VRVHVSLPLFCLVSKARQGKACHDIGCFKPSSRGACLGVAAISNATMTRQCRETMEASQKTLQKEES